MEAVAAVGVASAAVQFLDFSVKTLVACKEIRDSSTGSTKANEELTRSVKQLKAMQKTLQQSTHTLSNTYRQLVRAIQDCSRVADELLQLLEYVREVAQKSLGTMRSALRQVREGKRIEKLQTQLSDCQDRLHLALTAEMRDSLLKKLDEQGKNTDSMRSILSQKLDFSIDQIQALDRNVTQIAGAAQKQISTLSEHQRKASTNLRRGQRDLKKNIDSQFSKLSISSDHKEFLDSLYFPEMFARQESTKKNLPGTYDWVFEGKLPPSDEEGTKDDEELRSRISRWLRDAGKAPVFWVSGKPGSGKSSLMSFIMSDRRTPECLKTWAGNRVPHIFSFFFWKPGTNFQKTMTGFMRSLVWQMCKAKPPIIDRLLSEDPTLLHSPWTEARLAEILRIALLAYREDPVFFVIDGLDECADDHKDLLDALQGLNLNPSTKVCISSRPEGVFREQLKDLPFVRLQDLNYNDISKFAHTKLQRSGVRTTNLASKVSDNAEGVFLWAVLVCDSLCSGLVAEDDDETLLQRLRAYPEGLDDLFDRMFADLEKVHYESLELYFYAAQQPRFSVALAVASQSTETFQSLEHFGALCEREVTRITQQSKGLLQIRPTGEDDGHYDCAWSLKDVRTGRTSPLPLNATAVRLTKEHLYLNIEFVHRSAYDYILGATSADRLVWRKSSEGEIVHKALTGALWLAQYVPILHMAEGELQTTYRLGLVLRHTKPPDEVVKTDQKWFCGELVKLVDLLNSWTSAVKNGNHVSPRVTRWKLDRFDIVDSQIPLRLFWFDLLHFNPDFVASHSYLLWNRDDTYLNIAALFHSWSLTRFQVIHYKRSIDSAMSSVATNLLRRGVFHKKSTLPEIQRRRYCMLFENPFENKGIFISWEALSTCHDAPYVLKLLDTAELRAMGHTMAEKDGTCESSLSQTSENDKLMDMAILEAFCALVQGCRMFSGTPCYVQNIPLPLQLSVPMLYAYPPTSRYLNTVEIEDLLLSCRAGNRLRLSCFARRGAGSLIQAEEKAIPVSPVASYCLSSATTDELLSISKMYLRHFDATRLVGSAAEMQDCLRKVMDDIWDDAEGQLTAWEQLYLRACVKVHFVHCWTTRPSQVEASGSKAGAEQS